MSPPAYVSRRRIRRRGSEAARRQNTTPDKLRTERTWFKGYDIQMDDPKHHAEIFGAG
jgi:hypothetical protein